MMKQFLASFGVFNYVGTAVGYFIWQFTPTPVPIGIPIGLFTSTFSNLINLITLMPSVIYIPTRGLFDGYNIGQHLETGASIFQGFSDIIN